METHTHNYDNGNDSRRGIGRNIGRLVFLGFVLVAGYFLITEHRAHLFGALPFLLLAACPLMHLFHHHGHGGSHHHGNHDDGGTAGKKQQDTTSHLDH